MPVKVGVEYDKLHYLRIEKYTKKIEQLYLSVIREASAIGTDIKGFDSTKPFTFDDYPLTKARADKLLESFNSQMLNSIQSMTKKEWLMSCEKNDELVDNITKTLKLSKEKLATYKNRNLEALSSFQSRKTNGLNLSQRVWKYSNQFKGELEMGLDIGLGEGRSAAQLSRDLRQYLNNPDMLFRRVRDKRGVLQLSKSAMKYNPGNGVYRSSYKNAMRLTRTEVNMAYRTSDFERWKDLDFVVGIEVKRSNHIFGCPVCESLKGKYPKEFKFVGWHPQCRCFATSILSTEDEFIDSIKKDSVVRSKNTIDNVPDNFKQWIKDNQERIDNAKSKPFFINDNPRFAKVTKQYKSIVTGLEPEYARRIENRIDELLVDFPSDEMKLLTVHENEQNIGYWNYIENRMSINKDYNLLTLEQSAIRSKNANWTIQSNDPVKTLVDHEYGHTLTSKHVHTKTEFGEKIEGIYKKHMDFIEKGVHPEVAKAEFETDEFVRIIEADIEAKKLRYQTLRRSGETDEVVRQARDEWRAAEKLGDFEIYNDEGTYSKLMQKASEMRRKYPKSYKNEYGITVYPDWILESEFYVSRYALTNANEFAAECFVMALNSERQSIYVKEIMEIIKEMRK